MRNLLERMNELTYLSEHMVEIGILGIDKELKGKDGKTTILEYAVYNEFGTKNIPPRPFMRRTFEKDGDIISRYIDKRTEEVFDGKISGIQALKRIGEFVRSKIMKNISTANSWATPLSPSTIKRKTRKGTNYLQIKVRKEIMKMNYIFQTSIQKDQRKANDMNYKYQEGER